MADMTTDSIRMGAIVLLLVPTVIYGGVTILYLWVTCRHACYADNRLRQRLRAAGHAHAGVSLVLSLVMLMLRDRAKLPDGPRSLVQVSAPAAAILIPATCLLPVVQPDAERPSHLILLTCAGAVVLAMGNLTLGISLFQAI